MNKRTQHLFSLLGIGLSVLMHTDTFAQQSPLSSSYAQQQVYISPSNAGIEDYTQVHTMYRAQWNGDLSGPRSTYSSAHMPIGDQNGLGAVIYTDSYGVLKQTGAEIMLSFRFPVNLDYNFSFGLAPKVYQYGIDQSAVDLINPNDPIFASGNVSDIGLDGRLGFSLFSDDMLFSISVDNIAETQIQIAGDNSSRNGFEREYKAFAHFHFDLERSDDVTVEPYLMLRYKENQNMQLEVGGDFVYQDLIFAGILWRSQDALVARLGMRAKELEFSYQYEFGNSDLATYHNGTHELILGVRIFNDRSSRNNRWYDRHKKKETWMDKATLFDNSRGIEQSEGQRK